VLLREKLLELLVDLGDRRVLERLDRIERLRLARLRAANRADEKRVGDVEAVLALQVAVDVVRQEISRPMKMQVVGVWLST
jgi:hypothetical protein